MAVVKKIVKIGIYTYKTVEKMGEQVKSFTEVSLFNIYKINSFLNVCLDEFFNQCLYRLVIMVFSLDNLIEKNCIET